MKDGKYCVAVMSVGSGVGQSVIASCNLSRLPITTIGMGINPFAYGAYECDKIEFVPLIYSDDYIYELIKKCKKHNVDIIIPGLDDEALILSENISALEAEGLKVIVSREELIKLTRDKEKMCEELTSIANIFVQNYRIQDIRRLIHNGKIQFPLIAKPRGGFASKGIEILLDENDLMRVTEDHIVQELAVPLKGDPFRELYLEQISKRINPQLSEISIQVVTDKNGELMGRMASYNKLNNGVPIEIIPYENEYVWSEVDKLLPALRRLGHRGPLNIQGRLTDNGFKVFEMNARFTGITGLRALMGFNEVECCIKNWIQDDNSSYILAPINYNRFGIRQTADKAISFSKCAKVKELSQKVNVQPLPMKKNILVTGATGYLGKELIKKLALENNVLAFARNKDNALAIYQDRVKIFNEEDFINGDLDLGQVDYLIHCAFARPHCTNQQIAESLHFTNRIFTSAVLNQVPSIINISSQSVYGTVHKPTWKESTPIAPETVYGQAKYASELMLEGTVIFSRHTTWTSLRLASLSGGQNGLIPIDILAKFVRNVLQYKPIEILDGSQRMERLDVRDAADGIISLLKTNPESWQAVYNLGPNQMYTILEMAQIVIKVAEERYGLPASANVKTDKKIDLDMGMDSTAFYELTNWNPRFSLEDIVVSLFEYLGKEAKLNGFTKTV